MVISGSSSSGGLLLLLRSCRFWVFRSDTRQDRKDVMLLITQPARIYIASSLLAISGFR